MFEVLLDKQPIKFLENADKDLTKRIAIKLRELENDPVPINARRVVGRKEPVFRLRVGKYRILYRVNFSEKRIIIVKIDKRGRVYKT